MISILYVDDEPALLDISKQFLERSGEFSVDITDSAQKAIDAMSGRSYDAIVSDFQMPVMNGLDLLKQVRGSGNSVPFIIFTGRGREEVAIDALNSGADFYLQKGGDPRSQFTELRHKILQAVNRRKAEEAFAAEQKKCEQYLNIANVIFVALDTNGNIILINKKGLDTLGYSRQDIIGKNWFTSCIPEPERPHMDSLFSKMLSGDIANTEYFENAIKTRTGTLRTIAWHNAISYDEAGKISGTISSGIDITDQKQVEGLLRFLNKKLLTISSATRHDINNKLTILSGYMQLIKLEAPGTKIEDYTVIMEKAVADISKLLKFTKEYEKIGSEPPVWQNLHDVVKKSVGDSAPPSFTIRNDTAGVEIQADRLLGRVFANLIENTLRHGEKATDIHAWYEEQGEELHIFIEDNGVGIPLNLKEKIFLRASGKNIGFGLFFAREILSVTDIQVSEKGEPGKGARFEICVPSGMYRFLP